MLFDLALIVAGGALLYWGAEWLVAGAAALAASLGVGQLAIGLTVLAAGTSAPELVVSLVAGLQGESALAFGNVVGSNIANIGLVLGLTTLIHPPRVDGRLFKREIPFLLVATLATGPVLLNGQIDRYEGVAFLAAAIAFILGSFKRAEQSGAPESQLLESQLPESQLPESQLPESQLPESQAIPETADVPKVAAAPGERSRTVLILWSLLGLVTLVAGGELFVHGAASLAQALGVSERVIGLTLVALGTSLPELAASLVAGFRGHVDLAVGNILGSNLFNILFILGAVSTVTPIHARLVEVRVDLIVMTVMTGLVAVALRKPRTLTRAEGATWLGLYAGFIGLLAVTG